MALPTASGTCFQPKQVITSDRDDGKRICILAGVFTAQSAEHVGQGPRKHWFRAPSIQSAAFEYNVGNDRCICVACVRTAGRSAKKAAPSGTQC